MVKAESGLQGKLKGTNTVKKKSVVGYSIVVANRGDFHVVTAS